MKNKLIIALITTLLLTSCATDPKEVLKKSLEKCQEVQNGYYEMTRFVRYTGDSDTSVSTFKCFFAKIKDDTLSTSIFHNTEWYNTSSLESKIHSRENLYTGNEFVIFSDDSSAEVISKEDWPMRVANSLFSTILFTPFTDANSWPLYSDSDRVRNNITLALLDPEEILGTTCYHLKMIHTPTIDTVSDMKLLTGEYHLWVSKEEYLPKQYSIHTKNKLYSDTVIQYEKFVLTHSEINNLSEKNRPTLKSIPPNYRIVKFKGIGNNMPL